MIMANHTQLIQYIGDITRQNKLPGFDCPGQDISIELLFRQHLCDVYRVTSSPEGTTYTIKISNGTVEAPVWEAYCVRDVRAKVMINDIRPGLSPTTVASDTTTHTVIEEDLTGNETLQDRIILQSKVDHGITCSIASNLAVLHKNTHVITLGRDKFADLSSTFCNTAATDFMVDNAFRGTFDIANLSSDIGSETFRSADHLLRQPQFRAELDVIEQLFRNGRECLINGNLNLSNVAVQDYNCKLLSNGCVQLGPAAYDVGCLLAHYMMAHYIHMMTQEDNSSHRQVAYSMQDAVRKTVDTYLEEQTAYLGSVDEHRTVFISQVAAFAGVELIRRSLDVSDRSQPTLTDHVRLSILQSGQRLVSRYQTIDNTGRLLMIGLQLC